MCVVFVHALLPWNSGDGVDASWRAVMVSRPKAVFVVLDDDAAPKERVDEMAAEREQISRDIAVRVARVMLGTALREEVCELGDLDGVSLVIVPSMEWSGPVRDAIRLSSRDGKGPTTVRAGQPAPARAELGWAFIEISGRVGCEAAARIAIALSHGLSVVAVAVTVRPRKGRRPASFQDLRSGQATRCPMPR